MFNIDDFISTIDTPNHFLGLFSQKELVRLRMILFPEQFKYRTPKEWKGLNDPRFRKQKVTINSARKDSKNTIIEEIMRFKFTSPQIKIIILIFKMLEIIGAPKEKIIRMMEEANIPCFSKNPANKLRYHFLGWLYDIPSILIKNFIENARNRNEMIDFLDLRDGDINSKLTELAIPDSFISLPNACVNYARFFFLNELFQLRDYRRITQDLEIYPNEPKKWEQAYKMTFFSNVALTDLIDNLNENSFNKFKGYFVNKYSLDENIMSLDNTQIRLKIKEAMVERGEGRNGELWADPHVVWGGETKVTAKDGHICDSTWELKIDNYLFDSDIDHEKPVGASKGEYYRNRMMYPDWVIKGTMIELFGAMHHKDYPEKMEFKQNNNLLPLIGISKEDFETGRWRDIIQIFANF